jgi:type VI protein secretion system component VasK
VASLTAQAVVCLVYACLMLWLLWRDAVADARYWLAEMQRYREQADCFRAEAERYRSLWYAALRERDRRRRGDPADWWKRGEPPP